MSNTKTNSNIWAPDESTSGEALFVVFESSAFPIDVEVEKTDAETLARLISDTLIGNPEDDDDIVRFENFVDDVSAWEDDILNSVRPELSRYQTEFVIGAIAEGIAERILPLVSGRFFAVVRSQSTGAEISRRPIDDKVLLDAIELSTDDWYFDAEAGEQYRDKVPMIAKRYLEEGIWQTGPACKVKKRIYPSLFFAPPGTPRQRIFRPLAVCTKDSATDLGLFTEGLRNWKPLKDTFLVYDWDDEAFFRDAWERVVETCPINIFNDVETYVRRGKRIREWLEAQPEIIRPADIPAITKDEEDEED